MRYEKFGLYVRNSKKKHPTRLHRKEMDAMDILEKSNRAVCGVTEREVVVPAKNVATTVKRLERAGYHVIGTGYGKTPTKKVWFIRRGGL